MSALSGTPPSDADLLDSVEAGDRGAFEAFYRRYAAWLTIRLRYRCADDALVEDVVQETFLAVWRGSARYRDRQQGGVAGWLWRVGFRRLVDALRGQGSRDRLMRVLTRRRWRDESSAEEQLLLDVEHGDLGGALRRLSPELRAVIEATALVALAFALAAGGLRFTTDAVAGPFAAPTLLVLLAVAWFMPRRAALVLPPADPQWTAAHHRWAAVLIAAVALFIVASREPSPRRIALRPSPKRPRPQELV